MGKNTSRLVGERHRQTRASIFGGFALTPHPRLGGFVLPPCWIARACIASPLRRDGTSHRHSPARDFRVPAPAALPFPNPTRRGFVFPTAFSPPSASAAS